MAKYFNKYEDFLNEDKEKREKNSQKRKEKRTAKRDSNKAKKAEKLQQEIEDATSKGKHKKADNAKKQLSKLGVDTEAENKTEVATDTDTDTDNDDTAVKDSTEGDENTEGEDEGEGEDVETKDTEERDINKETKDDFRKMTPKELNDRLGDWNSKYAQEFKFQNDMPKSPTKNLADLMTVVTPERKSGVSEGIHNLVKFFANKSFDSQDIEISGYTSTTGSDSYNASLSDRRAESALNAIEALMKEEGIETTINFSTVGHGEDKNHLIVINDTESSDDAKDVKVRESGLVSDDILETIKDNPEARQELNRRVTVNIANLPVIEQPKEVEVVKDKEVDDNVTVDKPEQPVPENIQFNYDSYILLKESELLLKQLSGEIKSWNENNDEEKIKTVFISAHTKKPTDSNPKQEKLQDDLLFVLSTNRAYTVKRYLQQHLGDEIANDIKFYLFPVSSNMKREKKVEIHFDFSKHMQEAKTTFESLSSQYGVESGERGYIGKTYTTNNTMRDVIIGNLTASTKDGQINKEIPLELWYTKGRFGIGQEKDFDKFKKKMEKTLSKGRFDLNIKDFIYNSK